MKKKKRKKRQKPLTRKREVLVLMVVLVDRVFVGRLNPSAIRFEIVFLCQVDFDLGALVWSTDQQDVVEPPLMGRKLRSGTFPLTAAFELAPMLAVTPIALKR